MKLDFISNKLLLQYNLYLQGLENKSRFFMKLKIITKQQLLHYDLPILG